MDKLKAYIISGIILIIFIVIFVTAVIFNGDGGFKEMTTISGIYAVEKPQGYEVVCFVKKSSGEIDCLTIKEINEG